MKILKNSLAVGIEKKNMPCLGK